MVGHGGGDKWEGKARHADARTLGSLGEDDVNSVVDGRIECRLGGRRRRGILRWGRSVHVGGALHGCWVVLLLLLLLLLLVMMTVLRRSAVLVRGLLLRRTF